MKFELLILQAKQNCIIATNVKNTINFHYQYMYYHLHGYELTRRIINSHEHAHATKT